MILDRNALAAFVDGDSGVGDVPRRHTRAAIPVIVLGKLRYGIVGSQAGRRETPRAGRPG